MWFFENSWRSSQKNGALKLRRRFGRWYIWAHGYKQSSPGVNAIWRNACKRVRHALPQKDLNILMLGLGAGGAIKELHLLFPQCRITAVEYDQAMIDLMQELRLFAPYPAPVVLYGDARKIVPTLTELYDLILVDMFEGGKPPPFLKEDSFLMALRQRLAPQGAVVINVVRSAEYLDKAESVFPTATRWRYRSNMLGAFRNSM